MYKPLPLNISSVGQAGDWVPTPPRWNIPNFEIVRVNVVYCARGNAIDRLITLGVNNRGKIKLGTLAGGGYDVPSAVGAA